VTAPAFQLGAAIPAELRDRDQWVVWRLESRDGKLTKVPYCAPARKASSTDPATWMSYAAAVALAPHGFNGVGFVFSEADPNTGIDLDACRDPVNGTIHEAAQRVIERFNSWTEISQSGKGVHIFVRAVLPGTGKKRPSSWGGHIELYDRARFFAMTGEQLPGTPDTIEERQAAVTDVWTRLGSEAGLSVTARDGGAHPQPGALTADDQTLLDQIAGSKDGERLHVRFYAGDRPVDPSKGDYELAAVLCRHTTDDEQVKRLMWASALRRPKWEEHRTLVEITVRNARRANPGPSGLSAGSAEGLPLDVTLGEMTSDPKLLKVPAPISPWLVWRGELTLLVGREKLAGKTTLAASDAARAAKAGLLVVFVSAEESLNRVVKRFADLGAPQDRIILLRRWPQSWEEVEAVIVRRRPDAIYADSLASFLMAVDGKVPETSQGEEWQAKGLRFKSWATLAPEHLAGVCVLSHATRADGTYRGSTGIGAAPDTIITMRDVENELTGRRLETIGRWGFPSKTVRFVNDTTGYEDAEFKSLGALAVEQLVAAIPRDGAEVADLAETLGWSKDTVQKRLNEAGAAVTWAVVGPRGKRRYRRATTDAGLSAAGGSLLDPHSGAVVSQSPLTASAAVSGGCGGREEDDDSPF